MVAQGGGAALSFVIQPRPNGQPLHAPVAAAAAARPAEVPSPLSSPEATAAAEEGAAPAAAAPAVLGNGSIRLVGEVEWEEAAPSVVTYTLQFEDADGQWFVTRR